MLPWRVIVEWNISGDEYRCFPGYIQKEYENQAGR